MDGGNYNVRGVDCDCYCIMILWYPLKVSVLN